tara:strand:+ start:3098 stop:3490 length:393 start_codon:yes stop_codon:yes gene_type:complete
MENRYMNRTLITIVLALILALLWYGTYSYCSPNEEEETGPCIIEEQIVDSINTEKEVWIPTVEDIAYQDSMYTIIQNTQSDLDTIKESIIYILERLDYEDGTYDSIRYVKGSAIDKRRNKEKVDWSGTTQ